MEGRQKEIEEHHKKECEEIGIHLWALITDLKRKFSLAARVLAI